MTFYLRRPGHLLRLDRSVLRLLCLGLLGQNRSLHSISTFARCQLVDQRALRLETRLGQRDDVGVGRAKVGLHIRIKGGLLREELGELHFRGPL